MATCVYADEEVLEIVNLGDSTITFNEFGEGYSKTTGDYKVETPKSFTLVTTEGEHTYYKGYYGYIPFKIKNYQDTLYKGDDLMPFEDVYITDNKPWTPEKDNYYCVNYKNVSYRVSVVINPYPYKMGVEYFEFIPTQPKRTLIENVDGEWCYDGDPDINDGEVFEYNANLSEELHKAGDKLIITKTDGEKVELIRDEEGNFPLQGDYSFDVYLREPQYGEYYTNQWKVGHTYTITEANMKSVSYTGKIKLSIPITYTILPQNPTNPITAKGNTVTVKYNKKKNQTSTKGFTIKKAKGKLTYTKTSGNSKITVNQTSGKITIKKGLKKGKYKVKVKVAAAGTTSNGFTIYNPKTVSVTTTVKVK